MTRTFQRPPTAQQAVLGELRHLIATGRLRPGQQIVQDALAMELGVSRVPLREALKILEGEGQVSYVVHRGYFVTHLSLSDLLEVYRIRAILEAEAVRAAIPQMAAEDLDRLEEANADVAAAAANLDMAGMTEANRRLHFAVIEPSGLPRLNRMIGQLWDSTEVYRSVYFTEERNRIVVEEEHQALIEAVRAGDADVALSILDDHRRHAIEALRPVLEEPAGDETPGT